MRTFTDRFSRFIFLFWVTRVAALRWLTFDDEAIPFRPQGNSTLVTWREYDLEKGLDKADGETSKEMALIVQEQKRDCCDRTLIVRVALLWHDDRRYENYGCC